MASSNKKTAIRILHVDDELCLLEVSKQILTMENSFEIDYALSVDEALKKVDKQQYDAIVSDYEMTQKNGLEFLKELRDQNNQIPFILFTGKGREDVAVKALNLGADRYINKNGSPETVYCELADAINKTVESKKAQSALLVSEEKYRETIQNANIGVVAYRPDGEITILNPKMQKMTGYTIQEVPSLSEWFGKLYPNEEKRQKIKDKWFKKLTDVGEVKEGQATIVTKQGEERVFVFDGFRLHSGDFIAFTRDITELKKVEAHRKVLEGRLAEYSKHLKYMVDLRTAQLKDTNERLVKSERLAAIGELAGMVGHDLRNPLAGIKNAVYFLKKKGKSISEVQTKEMLETIDKALEHSDKIINDLLDYAREMHLELTKYAAHTLVGEALGMIQVPDRIQIINQVDEEAWIWVNADKMIRVFINLIKNAVDAMPQNGTLRISSCQTRDCVEIAFADTGKGIPEEILKKLFTPLFTTKAQGMGFGLAICKRIVEAHEGYINVKTELNKGTTFTVTLPLKPKHPNIKPS